MKSNLNIKNRRAKFDFELINIYQAGIMLTGTEIKSIRSGKAHINEAFCKIKNNELFIINMYIDEYEFGSYTNHKPTRTRKLLLTKKEIKQINKQITEKGLTIVPLKAIISERGFAKIDIAVAKGKKTHDKRQSMKERDSKREIDRMKNRF
ncbi:MAG: SsrA-binding protein SmpB [Chitinophagales bacterium]